MVFVITVNYMELHGEPAWSFMEELVKDLWEEAEVTDLDGSPYAVFGLRCSAGPVHKVEASMAVAED